MRRKCHWPRVVARVVALVLVMEMRRGLGKSWGRWVRPEEGEDAGKHDEEDEHRAPHLRTLQLQRNRGRGASK